MRLRKNNWIVTAVLAAGVWMTAGSAVVCAQDPTVNNENITRAIETDLIFDQAVSAHLVDVITADGVVTLTGTVDTLLAKERAAKIAESIKGVRAVINRIEVRPVERPDKEIERDIEQAWLWDTATESYEVNADVNDGLAVLTGEVDSWAERRLAARVAKNVRGLKGVENNIIIRFTTDRPDHEIAPEIEARLDHDAYVDAEIIDAEVDDGVVRLTGTVGSPAEQSYAYTDAWVAGVKEVDVSGLEIRDWVRDEMKKKAVSPRSDGQIVKAVKDSFVYDPRIGSEKINVSSESGIVTLSGVVDNLQEKRAAAEDARNTQGVVTAYNNIKVRPTDAPADSEIAQRIRSTLLWDPVVDRFEITPVVRNQKVYLYGAVDNFYEKVRAEDIASRVAGVVEIENYLTVLTPWPRETDASIKRDIEDELFWSWFIDSDDISVGVDNGVATLTGEADSWHEVYAAIANAFEGGARAVQSSLIVDEGGYEMPVHFYEDYYVWPYDFDTWVLEYAEQ